MLRPPRHPTTELLVVAEQFRRYARDVFKDSSPLYARLADAVTRDARILALAAVAPQTQPAPTLLFAVVHYLLLSGVDHPLARFFPTLNRSPVAGGQLESEFSRFCDVYEEPIRHLLQQRLVQTNEVGRCSVMLPAFAVVSRLASGRPLALIEVGCSAGLNLNWQTYAYEYGNGKIYGSRYSTVKLTCTVRGSMRPDLPAVLPDIESRIGIDLAPIDVRDDDNVKWLQALIWPDQLARYERLGAAVALLRKNMPRLVAGDASSVLPDVIAQTSPDAVVCMFDTFVSHQCSPMTRRRLRRIVGQVGKQRDIFSVSVGIDVWPARVSLVSVRRGIVERRLLGRCDYHGRWLEWGFQSEPAPATCSNHLQIC